MTAEEDFHRSRRMWAAWKGTVLVAPENDPRPHKEWLRDLLPTYWADAYLTWTRGYVKGYELAAYSGGDAFTEPTDPGDVSAAYYLFLGMDGWSDWGLDCIRLGAVPGRPGEQWAGRRVLTAEAARQYLAGRAPDGRV